MAWCRPAYRCAWSAVLVWMTAEATPSSRATPPPGQLTPTEPVLAPRKPRPPPHSTLTPSQLPAGAADQTTTFRSMIPSRAERFALSIFPPPLSHPHTPSHPPLLTPSPVHMHPHTLPPHTLPSSQPFTSLTPHPLTHPPPLTP